MKTYRSLFILLAVGVAGIAIAQNTATKLKRIQTDPEGGRVQAYFEKVVTVEGVEYRQPWQEVSWSLGDNSPVAITLADGSTAQTTRAAIFAAVQAIAAEEKIKADTPPANP